ncbi:MAG: flagellar biosynthetic protein FliO [Alphaproteobacteria bacterium]
MELGLYLRFFLALLFVVGLIAAVGWFARRHGFAGRFAASPLSERRLAVVELLQLDAKRRLALIRRDNVEHLVLLGATNDVLIENGISPPPGARLPAPGAPTGTTGGFLERLKAASTNGQTSH